MIDRGMKTLYLLRHAKSSWDDPEPPDHERPLAPRGRRAAKKLVRYLGREGIAPEVVLCSSARRARETLEGIRPALGDEVEVQVEPEIYGAGPDDLLERLRAIPDPVQSAMLIGHNPAIQALALSLAASGEDLERIEHKYPTGALATLTLRSSWPEVGPGTAELVGFVGPKDLD
jgi:phosphohistidine phosphatase